jgi:2'-5' RNA ligase
VWQVTATGGGASAFLRKAMLLTECSSMDRLNFFAVVDYLANPTAKFVDELRRELTPDCPHRAHVTVLPPRAIAVLPEEAIRDCERLLADIEPFEMRLGSVDLFEATQVIKLSFASGIPQLKALHDLLAAGKMTGIENFEFIPHITLGQDLPTGRVDEYLAMARRKWEAFKPAPPVVIESLTFVQQTIDGCWLDLAEIALGRRESVGVANSGAGRRIP